MFSHHYQRLILLLCIVCSTPAWAEDGAKKEVAKKTASKTKAVKKKKTGHKQYIRVARDNKGRPLALQTEIISYKAEEGKWKGVTVDLIGVVHIGDKDYYKALNKRFRDYDAVLYELVAPENANVPQPGRGASSASQRELEPRPRGESERGVSRVSCRIVAVQGGHLYGSVG